MIPLRLSRLLFAGLTAVVASVVTAGGCAQGDEQNQLPGGRHDVPDEIGGGGTGGSGDTMFPTTAGSEGRGNDAGGTRGGDGTDGTLGTEGSDGTDPVDGSDGVDGVGNAGGAEAEGGAGAGGAKAGAGGAKAGGAGAGGKAPECTAGETKKGAGCGNCGTEVSTCTASGTWGAAKCDSQGECKPGATKADSSCDVCDVVECSSSCKWGSKCALKSGAVCEYKAGKNYRCCGTHKWQFCSADEGCKYYPCADSPSDVCG